MSILPNNGSPAAAPRYLQHSPLLKRIAPAARRKTYWFGDRITHADIAVACTMRHLADSHPDIAARQVTPALDAHCAKMEAMPVFQEIFQAFIPPA